MLDSTAKGGQQSERDEREENAPRERARGNDNPRQAKPSEDHDQRQDDGKEHKRIRWPLIALGILVIVAAVGAGVYWYLTKDQQSTNDAYTDGRAVMIAPHVSGYVTELAVNDNQFVHKGDLLVQIEPKDYIAARDQAKGQLDGIQAQLDSARIALDKARTAYPAQLTQAQGQLKQAQGQLYQAQRENRRQNSMNDLATTQANRDTSDAGLQQAQGQVEQAQGQLRQAELVQQNIAQAEAQVKQLEGQAEQARGNLEQAEINLGYTRVTAPQDGWVTRRNVEMGNYLQAGGQIVSIVVPQVWITANFKETEITRMRQGQRATVRVDAYPQLKLEGHVDSIQLGSGQKFTAFPPENATGNFVKIVQRVPVKIVIDKGLDPQLPLPLGISVEPTVYFE